MRRLTSAYNTAFKTVLKKMRGTIKKAGLLNLIFIAFSVLLLLRQVPIFLQNTRKQGTQLNPREFRVLYPKGSPDVTFPPRQSNAVAIFWASWCGPCKIEMERLKNSVEKGKIPSGAIFAINPFEDPVTIDRFLARNKFPFTFIEDDQWADQLDIRSTPTTLFIEKGKLTSMSTGLGLLGIWRAEALF